jgi:ABC-type nickel/cobalt efflux system permease component RcnA
MWCVFSFKAVFTRSRKEHWGNKWALTQTALNEHRAGEVRNNTVKDSSENRDLELSELTASLLEMIPLAWAAACTHFQSSTGFSMCARVCVPASSCGLANLLSTQKYFVIPQTDRQTHTHTHTHKHKRTHTNTHTQTHKHTQIHTHFCHSTNSKIDAQQKKQRIGDRAGKRDRLHVGLKFKQMI